MPAAINHGINETDTISHLANSSDSISITLHQDNHSVA